jgi:hypothetical protein
VEATMMHAPKIDAVLRAVRFGVCAVAACLLLFMLLFLNLLMYLIRDFDLSGLARHSLRRA